jgi:hypothetical protein
MLAVLVQFTFAVLLFFAINWVGEHSGTFGYLKLGLNVREDSAPAFNFLLKALAPAVYVILLATALYAIHRDSLVRHIWLVAVYYFAFRLSFNLVLGRAALLNWFSVIGQSAVGIGATYLAYQHVVLPRKPLFPSTESIGNQLWVIVALFVYAVFNNVRTSTARAARRKNDYLRARLTSLRNEYGPLIHGQFPERYLELIAYAVLIYETFNRPRLAQAAERVLFPWFSHTLGPMQVRTDKRISDRESVTLGIHRLTAAYELTKSECGSQSTSRYQVIKMILAKYNRDETYINEVFGVIHTLWAQVVPEYRTEFERMYSPMPIGVGAS